VKKTNNEDIDSEFNNFNFATKAEPNLSKVVNDLREILILVLRKESMDIDRDLNMITQEMHSIKGNIMNLAQELKIDILDNQKSPQRQIKAAEVFEAVNNFADKLDSMNEMSKMTSLRLQMMLDRRSRFMSTLSNIMKKLSDTQNSLVQNLK
jgi:hypothetical protein